MTSTARQVASAPSPTLSARPMRSMATGFAAAAVSALCFVLSLAPIGWWPLAPVAVALLAWVALRPGRGIWIAALGLAWACAWWWLHRWIADVSLVGLPALVAYLTAWTMLIAWTLRRAARCALLARVPLPLLLGVVWTGFETLRAFAFMDGYPWYLLGHPMIEFPALAQVADLGGVTLVTALVAAAGGALLDLAVRRRAALRAATITAALVACACAYGVWRLGQSDALRPGPTILAIQTDLPTDNKTRWTFERQVVDFEVFARLTLTAFDTHRAGGGTVDLIAWPETMLPGFGLDPETEATLLKGPFVPGDHFTAAVRLMSRVLETPMLLGSGAYEGLRPGTDRWEWDRHYNSGYLLRPDGALERYDKLVLTPFGETMPYISSWPWLEQRLLSLGARGMSFELDVGSEHVRLALPMRGETVRIATPICFEDTVADHVRRLVWDADGRQAEVIVNLSNDGWFGRFDAGRWQHAQAARFRCIENRTPMVRVVNTGVTASYDSHGRLLDLVNERADRPGLGAGWLAATVTLDSRRPPAAFVGEVPAWSMLLLTAVLLGSTMIPGPRQRHPAAEPEPERRRRGRNAP